MICQDKTDMFYPLLADIYYPIIEQGAYGNVKKQWVLDRTLACFFNPVGAKSKKDVGTEALVNIDNIVNGRFRIDVTNSTRDEYFSLTNIIVTNIRDVSGNLIYNESAGPRVGQATLWEIATFNPVVGPFGKIEYYRTVLRRSENQAVDL